MSKEEKQAKSKNNELHEAPKEVDPFVSAEAESKEETANGDYKALKEQFDELDNKYKRLVADQINMSKRMQREREDAHKFAAVNTIEKILPAIDNFDFAKKSIKEDTDFSEIIKSIEMLKAQLLMSMQSVGLEEIDVSGKFNPEFHEALSQIIDPEKEEDTIVEVIKPGYKFKDKVIRVASVVVSSKGN